MIIRHKKTVAESSFELTPLIDIIFIVIVFLLMTSNANLLLLPVKTPTTEEQVLQPQKTNKALTVTLKDKAPYWAVDDHTFDHWQSLKKELSYQLTTNNHKIIVATDKSVPVENLLKLMAFLNKKNITDINIIMENTNEK